MLTDKDVTIYDIAKKLNISAATVSRGLNDHPSISKKTKKKIFDFANEIGYRSNHFASNLRSGKTDTIGVIVPRLSSSFLSTVISGIEHVINENGYNLLISQSSESEAKERDNAKTMFKSRVDGLLVSLAYDTQDLHHFNIFFKKKTPVIFFDRVIQHEQCTNVIIDNSQAGYRATRHLIEQGCKRIAHVTAQSSQNVYVDRIRGFKQALAEANIKGKAEDIITTSLTLESGAEAVQAMMKMNPRPDGVFVANDACAVGCIMALKQAGVRIPEDMAIVGFNNDPLSRVIEPNLSTISYSGYDMGVTTARLLINHLNGTAPMNNTNSIVLRSELIIRESSNRLLL